MGAHLDAERGVLVCTIARCEIDGALGARVQSARPTKEAASSHDVARTLRAACSGLVLGLAISLAPFVATSSGASTSHSPGSSTDPVASVDPFIGTGVGPGWTGAIGTFPGADLPSGMMQWSPDTPTTSPELGVSGGYYYPLDTIDGFTLTTCRARAVRPSRTFRSCRSPVRSTSHRRPTPPSISRRSPTATRLPLPGWYSVTLSNGIKVELTVTDRSGIGRFTFPQGVTPSILIDPEVSEGGFSSGSVSVQGDNAFSGSDVSGDFCSDPGNYTARFSAVFKSPFRSEGSWEGATLSSGDGRASGSAPGTYATFAPAAHGPTTITMKVGLSYTSIANASANLRAEQRGWSFDAVRQAAAETWNRALSRIAVTGGSADQRQVFYTALYHSLLFPSLLSDDDGDYPGLDGRVHVARGLPQYTNVSGWDIYRSQIPLLSILEPKTADGLVVSLVATRVRTEGSFPGGSSWISARTRWAAIPRTRSSPTPTPSEREATTSRRPWPPWSRGQTPRQLRRPARAATSNVRAWPPTWPTASSPTRT